MSTIRPRIPKRSRSRLARTGLLAAAVAAAAVALPQPAAALDPPNEFWSEAPGKSVNGTYTPIVGDFAGGAQDDIYWYAPGFGGDHLWLSHDDGTFSDVDGEPQVNGTYSPLVGDFAGSDHDDIFWYAPGPAPDHLWTSLGDGTFYSQGRAVSGTYQPVVLDDEAGKDDIVWARPGGGTGYVWSFEGAGNHLSTAMSSPAGSTPLVGHFGGGSCADVFWYAPGAAPDSLWFMNCAGHAGATFAHSVNGTYQPTVEEYSPNDDGIDDILWHRPDGTSYVWASVGDGTFDSTAHQIPLAGTVIPAAKSWGFAHVFSPTAQDLVFWDQAGIDDWTSPLANTQFGAGYQPVAGAFVGDETDVFWYKPGGAPERLFFHVN